MVNRNRIAGAAAVFAVALMAASVPLKSASAENDNWGRNWGNGGSFYFNTGPGYYYNPAPSYYYYSPPTYYYPPPTYYYPPAYGPSFGFSVRVH